MITLYGTPVRKLVKIALVGMILAALVVGMGTAMRLGVYEVIFSPKISEVEVQSTTRECLVGDFVAPARTPFGEIAMTSMFICGDNLLYEADPGDAVILNDYFDQWKGGLN